MNTRRQLFAGIFFIATLLAAPVASETPTPPIDKEAALEASFQTLVGNAQTAFDDGDYQAAIEYLLLAERKESEPALLLNIARSYERLDKCHVELAYYEAFLDNPSDDESLIERAEQALEEGADDCEAYHEELGGRLFFDTRPPGARLYIDGEFQQLTPTEVAALEPGTYTIRFEHDDYPDYTEEFEVGPDDERMTVDVDLEDEAEKQEDEEPDEVDPVVEDPDDDDEFALLGNPVALGLLGGSAAMLTTGLVLDLWMEPSIREERSQYDVGSDEYQELTDRRDNVAITFVAAYVAAGALAVSGASLIAYDYFNHQDEDDASDFAVRWSPHLDVDGSAGLRITGSF